MTKIELYKEIIIAKEGNWAERFNELTNLYLETYGVCYWFHEDEILAEIEAAAAKKEIPAGAYKHYKSERYVTGFGCYGYRSIETDLYEITFKDGESLAKVIFSDDLKIQRVVAMGKGAKKRRTEIMELGRKKFQDAI